MMRGVRPTSQHELLGYSIVHHNIVTTIQGLYPGLQKDTAKAVADLFIQMWEQDKGKIDTIYKLGLYLNPLGNSPERPKLIAKVTQAYNKFLSQG